MSDQDKPTNERDVPQANEFVVKIFSMLGMGPKKKPTTKPATSKPVLPASGDDDDGVMDEDVDVAKEILDLSGDPKDDIPVKDTPGRRPSMPAEALMTVVTRNEFYRDGFRNLIKITILEAVIIVGLILTLIVYINNAKSQDRYFATTADGRIMQLLPMDRPNMSEAALMSWVAQAATEVMTFGFHDYQRRLQQASRHFTKTGWESFTSALQKARIIDSVQALQQVVTAHPVSAPILLQKGVLNGKYRWIIQLPLKVTYSSGQKNRQDDLMLRLVVERVPSLENPNGVGIEQWIATTK